MTITPLVLSPALPSELLTYIIQHEYHPTTLIICSTRAGFLASLIHDVHQDPGTHGAGENTTPHSAAHKALSSSPVYQIAVARHIRLIFTPTVSHLRAYLAVFDPADSRVPPPPDDVSMASKKPKPPLLLAYGFLDLHRDTSEWSAQGISATAAALVEAGRRCAFRAVLLDAPPGDNSDGDWIEGQDFEAVQRVEAGSLLDEEVPVLSPSVVRAGGDLDDAAWTGRKVTLRRVLGRWFRYKEGGCSILGHEGFG